METEIAQLGGHSLDQLHVTGPALRAERRDDSRRDDDAADWNRWEHRKVLAAQSKERTAVAIGEKAKRADADEGLRQDMQEEAPQEFFGGNRHLPLLVMAGIVLPAEGDMGSVEGKNAGVGNGDTMRVAGQITKHLLRTGERALGVDNPSARIGLPAELVEDGGLTDVDFVGFAFGVGDGSGGHAVGDGDAGDEGTEQRDDGPGVGGGFDGDVVVFGEEFAGEGEEGFDDFLVEIEGLRMA